MGEVDVNTLTMEQYLALTRGNQAPGVVKPGIGGNVNFEIESQFMRELREDMFSGSNNDNPHEHVERILDIVSLFNIPRVTHDAVMLRSSRDIVHHPKQLQDIHNFKQEGDETLYQAWERKVSSGNSVGIVAIANKLDSLRHDIKKLKENVHAIQVGCETCGGAHLDNDCLLRKEVKSIEEVKYRESGRPFPSKGGNGDRYRVGSRGYYLRVNDRPPFGERKLSLTEIINKYMEQSVKKQVEKDEWLRKFHKNTEANRERHDEIIRNLETKVKTLAREVEGRATEAKFEECKAIFIEDGSPLYTPFYYSLKEIKYFSANSGFSDDENQEIKEAVEIEEIITHPETTPPMVSPCQPKKVSYYVAPYEPPIPLPGRLTQHAEEALVHKTMESLKWIRINRPLLKEIRQTKDYAKHIKNLVLPPKEQDPRSFVLSCSIGKLTFNNALADLGASVSIMPFLMYKRLGIRKLKPFNMVIEMADNTRTTPKGIVENLLVRIDKFNFPVDFVILDMVEDLRIPIILGRPLLARAHAKVDIFRKSISLEVGNEKVIFKIKKTTIHVESVCAIGSEYEIYVQESYEDIKFKWSMIDQGEPWDEPEK
ncbi:hypothetical protein Tco_0758595 [Tanacetum coccineum]